MSIPPGRSNRALLILFAIWAASRIYPWLCVRPFGFIETTAAKKMLEYGFLERRGAILQTWMAYGHLPNPAEFNYVHHPVPIYWLWTLVYAVAGGYGILVVYQALMLAGVYLNFRFIESRFGSAAALFSMSIFVLSPISLRLDFDPNSVAVASLLWPAALCAIFRSDGTVRNAGWVLGLVVFIFGQVNWLFAVFIPAFLCMVVSPLQGVRPFLSVLAHSRHARIILAATVLSVAAFAVQIVAYEAHLEEIVPFLTSKAAISPHSLQRHQLYGVVLQRIGLYLGFSLIIGALYGFRAAWRSERQFTMALGAFFLAFLVLVLLLPNYCQLENHLHLSLAFPMAWLVGAGFQTITRTFRYALLALLVPGIFYTYILFATPFESSTSRKLADFLKQHTKPEDVVVTNIRLGAPPFPPADVNAGAAINAAADRLVFYGVDSEEALRGIRTTLRTSKPQLIFLLDKSRSDKLDSGLQRHLNRGLSLINVDVEFDPPASTFARRVRGFAWKNIMRRTDEDSVTSDAPMRSSLELVRLPDAAPSDR